jgi:Protein of unknown function (DUF2490)
MDLLSNRKTLPLFSILMAILSTSIVTRNTEAQIQTPATESQIWPEIDEHVQFASHMRLLAFTGLEQSIGGDIPFRQWYTAAAFGYQFKPILREHLANIDPDKEHYLLLGGGYTFLRTTDSGKTSDENRITLDGTPGFLFPGQLLVRDRSWLELRWISGKYSTTYRNQVTAERNFIFRGVRLDPFGSAEFFYDDPKHSWDQQWYTAGLQWPSRHRLMLNTYYRRENCSTCKPTSWNVAGATLNFYFGNGY